MATRPTITVGYKTPSSGSPSTITVPIQRVSWNVGRRNLTDNWTSSIATIFGRNPDTLFGTAGTGGPQINDVVRIAVSDGGSEFAYFYGSIQDVRILYGFSTNYDTWEITVQGRYGSTGRNDQSFTTTAGDSTSSLALAIRTTSLICGPPVPDVPNKVSGWRPKMVAMLDVQLSVRLRRPTFQETR